jgi:hypothetical protein
VYPETFAVPLTTGDQTYNASPLLAAGALPAVR